MVFHIAEAKLAQILFFIITSCNIVYGTLDNGKTYPLSFEDWAVKSIVKEISQNKKWCDCFSNSHTKYNFLVLISQQIIKSTVGQHTMKTEQIL